MPRFVLWAALLVGVAAGAGFAGFSSWIIAGLVFGSWVIVAFCERRLSGPWTTTTKTATVVNRESRSVDRSAGTRAAGTELPLEPELSSVVRVTGVPPVEEPAVVLPVPRRRVVPRRSQPALPAKETQWNVWTLEEVARENAPGNDELVYLTVSLRDFADANGLLPIGFDPLVRESFGPLLPLAG
jgi:hypothetical protein